MTPFNAHTVLLFNCLHCYCTFLKSQTPSNNGPVSPFDTDPLQHRVVVFPHIPKIKPFQFSTIFRIFSLLVQYVLDFYLKSYFRIKPEQKYRNLKTEQQSKYF